MTAQALRGHPSTELRAVNRTTNITRNRDQARPDLQAVRTDLAGRTGRRFSLSAVKRFYQFFLAQADADADFREWVITYADPTGEQATNNVLWGQAKELTA